MLSYPLDNCNDGENDAVDAEQYNKNNQQQVQSELWVLPAGTTVLFALADMPWKKEIFQEKCVNVFRNSTAMVCPLTTNIYLEEPGSSRHSVPLSWEEETF